MQFINWEFGAKMESMTTEQVRERIEKAYNWPMPKLWNVPYLGNQNATVTYDYGELVARCPVTGIPDLYRVIIDFVPDTQMPELKSLKLYLMDYYSLPISHEHLCSKIYEEFRTQVSPKRCYVRLLTSVRGGIYTTVFLGDKEIASDAKIRVING